MGVISRGIRNAFRNSVRTFSITIILALSIATALIMFLSLQTVQTKIDSVKSSIGNTLSVSPAGVRGFEGGGDLLTADDIGKFSSLPNVISTTSTLSDRLSLAGSTQTFPFNSGSESVNNTTDLVSPVSPGSFGNRQRAVTTGEAPPANFSMPVQIIGVDSLDSTTSLSTLGGTKFSITAGDKFDAKDPNNNALIGLDLASKNTLGVGDTFSAYDQTLTVVGIFDAGNTFANASAVIPLETLQELSDQAGLVNSVTITTDSIESVTTVKEAVTASLGSDKVDISTQLDNSANVLEPLQNIKTVSLYSLIGSVSAGSIIILLVMIMIVRERRREIGVLKAIGSSNIKIVGQFITESLTLTTLASIVGIIIGAIASNPVLKVLVSNNQNSAETIGNGINQAGGFGAGRMPRIAEGLANTRETILNLQATIGWEIIAYGLLAALLIALIGSAIPAFFIAKIRPAEVMRTE